MSTPLPFSIPSDFKNPPKKFLRQLKRLPQRIKEDFKAFIQEMSVGQPKPGRRLEKLSDCENMYSARLGGSHRVIYKYDPDKDGDTGAFTVIGNHDNAYR